MSIAPVPVFVASPAIVALGLTYEQLRVAVLKAQQYDDVQHGLDVADSGKYRADTLQSVVEAARANAKAKDLIERIAHGWDGCMYDAVGETIDIGADIRASAKLAFE